MSRLLVNHQFSSRLSLCSYPSSPALLLPWRQKARKATPFVGSRVCAGPRGAPAIDERVPTEEALVAEAKDLLLKLRLQEAKQNRSAYCAVAYHQLAKLLGSEYQPISYQTDFRALRDKAPEQSFLKATERMALFWTPDLSMRK